MTRPDQAHRWRTGKGVQGGRRMGRPGTLAANPTGGQVLGPTPTGKKLSDLRWKPTEVATPRKDES